MMLKPVTSHSVRQLQWE